MSNHYKLIYKFADWSREIILLSYDLKTMQDWWLIEKSLWYDVIDFLSDRELGLPVLPRILTRYVDYFLFFLIMRIFKRISIKKKNRYFVYKL